jgi:hypothetical protein
LVSEFCPVKEASVVPDVAYCSPKGAYAEEEDTEPETVVVKRELPSQSAWR